MIGDPSVASAVTISETDSTRRHRWGWARLWIAPAAMLLALVAGLSYLAHVTPLYTATARVTVDQSSDALALHRQVDLLKSTDVLAAAARSLGIEGQENPVA